MNKRFIITVILFLLTTLAATVGCGPKRPADLPQLHPTTITIKANGKPVAEAVVRVVGTDNPTRYTTLGRTDAKGVAVLETQTPTGYFKGAPEGNMAVGVTKTIMVKPDSDSNNDYPVSVIETQYGNPQTSGFTMTVTKSGPNTAEFEVTAKPEAAEYLN